MKKNLIKLTKNGNSITVRLGTPQEAYWLEQGFKDLEPKKIDDKKTPAKAEGGEIVVDVVEEVKEKKPTKKRAGRRKKTEAAE